PEQMEYRTNGFQIFDITESDTGSLVYEETPEHFVRINILSEQVSATQKVYYLNDLRPVVSDLFDGIQLTLDELQKEVYWDSMNTGWVQGWAPMNFDINRARMLEYPWRYDFVFTDENNKYTTQYPGTRLYTLDNRLLRSDYFLTESYPFYVENKHFIDDSTGEYKKLEIFSVDTNLNGQFDLMEDEILIGYPYYDNSWKWAATLFSINFQGMTEDQMPRPGDVFRVDFGRPFAPMDSVLFKVASAEERGVSTAEDLDKIKVVPNPYIMTNTMEPAVRNNSLNQRRKLMFVNVPARCTIKLFTMSGYFVDSIEVNNDNTNGIVHWDMLTKESLEIAPGVYIYHVESHKTGNKKMGKFAVIK
ncbi:hypothetical protein JW935_17065, partial [candidate division KSB1 bacterium]|nr:hypothetical protein [candidate division KSB1 bacterium]